MSRPARTRTRPPSSLAGIPLLLLVALVTLVASVTAHSPHPPPVGRVHHPERSSLRIRPRHGTVNGLTVRSRVTPQPHSLRFDDTLLLTASVPSLLPFNVSLLLRPTEHLIHPNAKITFQGGQEPLRAEDWRLYTGSVIRPNHVERAWSEEDYGITPSGDALIGHASVMVHDVDAGNSNVQWEGMFSVRGTTYHVMTRANYERIRNERDAEATSFGDDLVIFSDAEMLHDQGSSIAALCGHDKLGFNTDVNHPVHRRSDAGDMLVARDDIGGTVQSNYIDNINSTTGCPSSQSIVYMGVAMDCNYVTNYDNKQAATTKVLNNWNMVSALYQKTFKISLGILEINAQEAACPSSAPADAPWNVNCSNTITLDNRLSTFSQWRGNRSDDGIGLWHLLTNCATDTEVGVAWLGQLCETNSQQGQDGTVSGTGISTSTATEWNVIAHEIGHGFGAIHDCEAGCSLTGQCCPFSKGSCDAGGQYIMNPTTGTTETSFSACTLGNVCTFLGANNKDCVQAPDASKTILSLNKCGNGIVEAGEDCDPGSANSTACCTSDCKFTSGSVCDPNNSGCCTDSCQYAPSSTVCRASINAICDMTEYCTGNNATCPDDKTAKDGTSCGSDGLACASGHCTSLNAQCVAAGASLNLTTACGQRNDQTCVVSCKTPGQANMCTELQTTLIDGSPCGYGGHCYTGKCQKGSWQDVFKSWYTSNLNISIPVTIAVGLIVLFILYSVLRALFRCCAGGGVRNKGTGSPTDKPMPMSRTNGRGGRDFVSSPQTNYQPLDGTNGGMGHQRQQSSLGYGGSPTSPQDYGNAYGHQMGNMAAQDPYAHTAHGGMDYSAQPYAGAPRGGQHSNWVDAAAYNGPSYPDEQRQYR